MPTGSVRYPYIDNNMLLKLVTVAAVSALTWWPQTLSLDPTVWTIDGNHSGASFSVRHLVVSTVRGKMGPVSGKVWYDGTDVTSIRAEAAIDVAKINTGLDTRDSDLRGADFFAVNKYPRMTFKSKRAVRGAAPGKFQLIGDLTIRDVTREVTLEVDGPSEILKLPREWRVVATATTTINRFDYGLKWNQLVETGGAVVGPDVNITIDLEVTRFPA